MQYRNNNYWKNRIKDKNMLFHKYFQGGVLYEKTKSINVKGFAVICVVFRRNPF